MMGLPALEAGLDMAADVGENLLLEYTDGHPTVGWGRVDHARLVELLRMHVLGKTLEHRNCYTARAHSSNIMAHIMQTLEEGVNNAPVAGSRVPRARFVFSPATIRSSPSSAVCCAYRGQSAAIR